VSLTVICWSACDGESSVDDDDGLVNVCTLLGQFVAMSLS
jgi:hypothetical protein